MTYPYRPLQDLQPSARCDENNTALKRPVLVWSVSMIRSFVLSLWPLASLLGSNSNIIIQFLSDLNETPINKYKEKATFCVI